MAEPPIRLTVNGEDREFPRGITVEVLLETLEVRGEKSAVEVNKTIVPRAQHASHVLVDGDVVEIVSFVGGG